MPKRIMGGDRIRKPSHQRYNQEGRWLINKIKRITKACGAAAASAWKKDIGDAKMARAREASTLRAKGKS